MRFLILLALIVFLAFFLRSLLRSFIRQKPENKTPEKMVACVHCGLYLPESEATLESGRYFCGREHQLAWRNKQE